MFLNPNGFATSPHPTIFPIIPRATNVSPNRRYDQLKPLKSAEIPIYEKNMGEKIIYPLTTTFLSTNCVSSSPLSIIPAIYAPVIAAIPKNFSAQKAKRKHMPNA